jgi:hypothetical protein
VCEVGIRTQVIQAFDGVGGRVTPNVPGIVIGHLGTKWAIVSLTAGPNEGDTVLMPEGQVRPINGGQRGRAVVVQPSGQASPLSRRDTVRARVHVRKP